MKINGKTVKASQSIRRGDSVNVLTLGGLRILKVLELSTVRGPYSVAQTLYEDHTPAPDPKEIAPPRMSHELSLPDRRAPTLQ